MRAIQREFNLKFKELQDATAEPFIGDLINDIQEKYKDNHSVFEYLNEVCSIY
jgi:hypothetical protein